MWSAGVLHNAAQHGLRLYWNKQRGFYFDSKHYPKSSGLAISQDRLLSALDKGYAGCGEDKVWWTRYHDGKIASITPKGFEGEWDAEQGVYVQPEEQHDMPLNIYGMNGWNMPMNDHQLLMEAEKMAKQWHKGQKQRLATGYDEHADKRYYLREVMQDHGIDTLREVLTKLENNRETDTDITGWLADKARTIHKEILSRELPFDEEAVSPSRKNLGRQEEDLPRDQVCFAKAANSREYGTQPIIHNMTSDPSADISVPYWKEQAEHVKNISAKHRGFRAPLYPFEKRKMRRIKFPS